MKWVALLLLAVATPIVATLIRRGPEDEALPSTFSEIHRRMHR